MAPIGNHTFRATGITAYLANGGALEHAQAMAAHESPHDQALRPDQGAADAGRGRADQAVRAGLGTDDRSAKFCAAYLMMLRWRHAGESGRQSQPCQHVH